MPYQIHAYFRTLASDSNRMTIVEFGKMYEQRSMVLLTVTSPENQKNIEAIRMEHLKPSNPGVSASLNAESLPVLFAGNPNFRAFWLSTSKLFLNGIFFGSSIR